MSKKEFGIYSITNICTGDMYIGQTIRHFTRRWNEHKRDLNSNNHNNKHLQSVWNKYGEEAFLFQIIHKCDELDNLNELEKYYIKKYDCYKNGYNLTLGGDGFVYDEEKNKEIRKRQSEISKNMMRNKSKYTEKQIENVKILLCEETVLSVMNRVKEISKLTGVSEKAIMSIKQLNSWVDVRVDLNEKMIKKDTKTFNFDEIYDMFVNKQLTIGEISKRIDVSKEIIKNAFIKNKKSYAEQNKRNKIKYQNKNVVECFEKGFKTVKEIKEQTGYSDYIIHRALDENGTSIRRPVGAKHRINREKNCDVKGINWDISTQKWFLRISYEKKQIPIGKFADLDEAIKVREELLKLIKSKDYNTIIKIKEQYRRESTPKKKVKAINIYTGEVKEIEGINEAARVLNLDNERVRDVLRGKQKTHKGYRFEYC